MEGIFVRLLPICFMWTILLTAASALTCYECQERRAGDWCSQPKKQECNVATSICLKYLHKEGKPGFPNHVLAKCELRTYYTQSRINACVLEVRNRNGSLTVSETCTCESDLCNDAILSAAKMLEQEKSGSLGPSATPAPTEPPDSEDQGEGEAEGEDHEDGDEAVESATPEVKNADESSEEATEPGNTGATKAVSWITHGIAAVVVQLVLFSQAGRIL